MHNNFRKLRSFMGRLIRSVYRRVIALLYAGRVSARLRTNGNSSILIVRGDAIGDFILFLPALGSLRRRYSGAKVTLLTAKECVELAANFGFVDEIIPYDRTRYRFDLIYRIRLIGELRARQFDVALNPVYSREPLTDELLYCSGAAERIVSSGDVNSISRRMKENNNKYCTRILPSKDGLQHEPLRNMEYVEQLMGADLATDRPQQNLPLTEAQIRESHTFLLSHGLDPDKDKIVVMFPGALNPIRLWPIERFAQLIDLVSQELGAKVLLCGSESQTEDGETICQLSKIRPTSVIGKTTLTQLAGIFHLSSLYVGNESGPLHIAAAAGAPTVCILGGGHFGRFYPYSDKYRHRAVYHSMPCYHCNWQCIYEVPHCIHEISLEQVWTCVQGIFKEVVLPRRSIEKSRHWDNAVQVPYEL